jgi:hypothetical protein
MIKYVCPGCNEPLLNNLEEQLTVTVLRVSRIVGIEYEAEDGEICFDYDALPNEYDVDCDTPVIYQCGFCGYEINKQTVVEVLHGSTV